MNFDEIFDDDDRSLWKKIKKKDSYKKTTVAVNIVCENEVPPIDTEEIVPNQESIEDVNLIEEETVVETNCTGDFNFTENEASTECESGNIIPEDSDEESVLGDYDERDQMNLREFHNDLKDWAISYQIKRAAVNSLLNILKTHIPQNELPKDARTLIETPRATEIYRSDDNGQYWHYGLRLALTNALRGREKIESKLSLNFNIDGLPPFKRSSNSLWPILVNIQELRDIPPLVVGVYCGKSELSIQIFFFHVSITEFYCFNLGKPSDPNTFLKDLVAELGILLPNGLKINDCHIKCTVRSFICDTPARALLRRKFLKLQ